ncbi:hypothetical protein RB195_003418 [Necator americanus]|uniref:Tyr recombinase domain-containing protein n=1 Tax=Necator americanus TaxID=51031 RepID=A0ABR1DNG9_NECAM
MLPYALITSKITHIRTLHHSGLRCGELVDLRFDYLTVSRDSHTSRNPDRAAVTPPHCFSFLQCVDANTIFGRYRLKRNSSLLCG